MNGCSDPVLASWSAVSLPSIPSWPGTHISETRLTCQSQSYFTTSSLPQISSSWRQAPWDSRPVISFSNRTLAVIVLTLSDKRMGVSFTIAAGPRQRSHSQVRVPRNS
jgi:hypothetical protein